MPPFKHAENPEKRESLLLRLSSEEYSDLVSLAKAFRLPVTHMVRLALDLLREKWVELYGKRVAEDAQAFVERQAKKQFRMLTKGSGPWRELEVLTHHRKFMQKLTPILQESEASKILDEAKSSGGHFSLRYCKSKGFPECGRPNVAGRDIRNKKGPGVLSQAIRNSKRSSSELIREKLAGLKQVAAAHWFNEAGLHGWELGFPKVSCDISLVQLTGTIRSVKYEIGAQGPSSMRRIQLGADHLYALGAFLEFLDPRRLDRTYIIRTEDFQRRFAEPNGLQLLGGILCSWVRFVHRGGMTVLSSFSEVEGLELLSARRFKVTLSKSVIPILQRAFTKSL